MGRAIFINKIWYSITIIISLQTSEYLFVYHIKHYYYEKSLFICITYIGYSLGQTYFPTCLFHRDSLCKHW